MNPFLLFNLIVEWVKTHDTLIAIASNLTL